MTTIERPGGDLLDNLPLLTQVVETDMPDDLHTLTEIVADTANAVADTKDKQSAILAAQENGANTPKVELAGQSQPIASQETAVPEIVVPEATAPPPRILNEEELQQILHHLEAHLETMLASKFSLHFEKLRDALNAHLDSKIQ